MKNFLLHLKLRQFKWLANFMALTLAIETATLPLAQADKVSFICLGLMDDLGSKKDPAALKAQADEDKARKKEEGKIRLAQSKKAHALDADAVTKLVAYYKDPAHTDEVEPWLEDLKIRKDSGLVTDVEDMAALAITNDKASDLLATLLPRRNISIRYGSLFDLFHFSDLQKYQATVKRSSSIPLWVLRLVKGFTLKYHVLPTWSQSKSQSYSRAFTITLQRQIPQREDGDLSSTVKPNTNYAEYSDSEFGALNTVKDGSDPQFTRRDLKRKVTGIIAVGKVFYHNLKIKLNYEPIANYIPVHTALRQLVIHAFRTSLQVANSTEAVEDVVRDPDLVNGLVLDLNQKTILENSDPVSFINRIADRTALREIPKSALKTALTLGGSFIVWMTAHKIILAFFPAGDGNPINGKNMVDNAACDPTSTDKEDVMNDTPGMKSLSPFQKVFYLPNQKPGHNGEINPCDPEGAIANGLKAARTSVNNNDDDLYKWIELNQDKYLKLRDDLRARFNYTDPKNPSACAIYYSWYTRCGPGFVSN